MKSEEIEFMKEICKNPEDDTVRLVYADWMDENDQPLRAEFVRLQIDLAKRKKENDQDPECVNARAGADGAHGYMVPSKNPKGEWRLAPCIGCWRELRDRERKIFKEAGQFQDVWMGKTIHTSLPRISTAWTVYGHWFERGFVARVTCDAGEWVRFAHQIAWLPQPCGACNGHGGRVDPTGGFREFSGSYPKWSNCHICRGHGKHLFVFPQWAQPIREVLLYHPDGQRAAVALPRQVWGDVNAVSGAFRASNYPGINFLTIPHRDNPA